jgi:hypothetical protein
MATEKNNPSRNSNSAKSMQRNTASGRYVVRRDAVTKGGTMNPARPAAHIDFGSTPKAKQPKK